MPLGFFQNQGPPIAIEFGTSSLKAIQMDFSKPQPQLIAAGMVETPEKLLLDDLGRLTFQAENLGDLLKRCGFKGKRAVCSLPAKQTVVQHLQVASGEGDIQAMVNNQMQMQMGIDPKLAVIRAVEVGDVQRGGNTKSEVICFAVARDVVFKQIEAIRQCKLEPVGIHSSQVAITRAFDRITRRQGDEKMTSLYLDIGAGTTKIVIAHGQKMAFAKTIDVAGRTFDELISKQLDCGMIEARKQRLSLAEMSRTPETPAERVLESVAGASTAANGRVVKGEDGSSTDVGSLGTMMDRRTGNPMPNLTPDLSTSEPVNLQAGGLDLTEPLEWLTDEITMCVRYHNAMFPGRVIDRAIFVGGESRHIGMCQHIAKLLRTSSQIADPLAHVKMPRADQIVDVDFSFAQPGWVVPYGLCCCPLDE
ncbi:MAG: pilus assembly protein PilM [Planctomycetota bacterium]|jgi:Tfp pilus assembly PilM family ATPase